MFRNRGDGTFEDVTRKAGVGRTAFTKGVAWGDYDNDGYPDLYVSNYGEDNFLYRNRGDGTFDEVGKRLGVEKPIMSFTTWFFDYDNDGWLDLFVASFVPSVAEVARGYLGLPPQAETMKLYRNDTKGGFQDVTNEVGLNRVVPTMGANFGDLDNDGFLDLYLGTGAPSFAALDAQFRISQSGWEEVRRRDRGDRHGPLAERPRRGLRRSATMTATKTFTSTSAASCRAITITKSSSPIRAARITGFLSSSPARRATARPSARRSNLTLTGANGQKSLRYREVTSGGSFGASSLRQEIGLGRARQIDVMEVWWPASGSRQVFRNVKVNQFIEIKESEENYRARSLRSFALPHRAGKS